MTLVELLVAGVIASFVLTSLCGVYFLVGREWERQRSKQEAIAAATDAASQLASYSANATYVFSLTRFTTGDTLVVCLPADTAYGVSVPVWDGSQYHYRLGTWVIFYLSDKTGSYRTQGNILWAGTVTNWSTFPDSVVPDSSWSLYNGNTGKLTPITSLAFTVTDNDYRSTVAMQIGTTYKVGRSSVSFTHSRVQSARNEHPI